jgi:hypothetical protein
MKTITLLVIAIVSLTIAPVAKAEMLTLQYDIVVTDSILDVFNWDKLVKDNDWEACREFVAEHKMIRIRAGTVVFLDANEIFDYYTVRIKGSPTDFYSPLHQLH